MPREDFDNLHDDEENSDTQRSRRRRRDDDDDDDYEPRSRRRHYEPHRGTLILVLGILGLVACGPIGIAAWLMGKNDLAEMRAGRMDPEGEGMTKAGYILGIVAMAFLVLTIGFMLLFFLVAGMNAR